MARNYEVVVFGDQEQGFIMEVCEALDPNGMIIAGRIGREGTMLRNGTYIKDFSYLGRPVKEVVYIDYTDDVVPYHTENTILLPEWDGDGNDRSLYDIIPFLESKFICFTDIC
jgi:TFIIF-interacting CTD phosphatase-like protein